MCICSVAWLLPLPAGLGLVLGAGAFPSSAASPPALQRQPGEKVEQYEARLDATLWPAEVQALQHERPLFRLRDEIRAATNKLEGLARFSFEQITVPSPLGPPRLCDLGILSQSFDDAQTNILSQAEWAQTLRRLSSQGWRLDQVEWTHERFLPAQAGHPARSTFQFELHGQRQFGQARFIVRGLLQVAWSNLVAPDGLPTAQRLMVSNLSVLERQGDSGFTRIGVVTPSAPDRRGELVDLHPVIATDVDGDGDDDIVLAGVNRVLVNRGDATFDTKPFVAEENFHGARVAAVVGDFNGDGQPDLVTVATQGTWSNQVVLHPGAGCLPLTGEPTLAAPSVRTTSPAVLTAGDIDRDGDLDLWLGQYKQPFVGGQMPTPYYDANDGHPSFLLLNDGTGRFEIATAQAGLFAKSRRRTIAASLADLDDDGDLDLVTVNDFSGVDLFYNDGHGHFADESRRLYNRTLYGMTHCFADFDRDGRLDFFVSGMYMPTVTRLETLKLGRDDMPEHTRKRADMAYGNRIYLNRDGQWIQPPFANDVARSGWTWGTTAADFDNDGDVDLYLANGQISGASVEDLYDSHHWRHDIYLGTSQNDPDLFHHFLVQFADISTLRRSYNGHQHNTLFLNLGTNHYVNVAYLMDLAYETDCRAVVSVDLDNDGRLDLLVTESEWFGTTDCGRNRLFIHRNVLPQRNHWIGARLDWGKPGVSPFGAKVIATAGGRTFLTQIMTGTSYQCQPPNTALFGLGGLGTVEELRVVWPNGQSQLIRQPAIDRYHRFTPP